MDIKNHQTSLDNDSVLTHEMQQLRKTIEQIPRFDWKWFLGLVIPLVLPILAAGIIGYFGIQSAISVIQRDIQHLQTDVTAIASDLKETNQRLDEMDKRLQNFEIRLVKIEERLKDGRP